MPPRSSRFWWVALAQRVAAHRPVVSAVALVVLLAAALFPLATATAQSPSLAWPPDGWTVDILTPNFRWTGSGYTHLLVQRVGGEVPAVDVILAPGIDSFVPLAPLNPGATYRWRIRSNPLSPGQSPYTWTQWTGEWRFSTTGAPPSWATASHVALAAPVNGTTLDRINPTLAFRLPPGAQQLELVLIPSYNPNAAITLVRPATSEMTLPAPPAWYGMLPGTTYYWRVRATNQTGPLPADHPSWSAWSETWSFRTPIPSGATARPVSPDQGRVASSLAPTLVWGDAQPANFYYEVQVSRDPNFVTDPLRATAMVYWEVRHGGLTTPPNSYTVPSAFPLYPGVTYYWRVRPWSGDNPAAVAWSSTWSFISPGVSGAGSAPQAATTGQVGQPKP
ncbi:MAG: hypothetical protein HY689_10365 [Chloroflexi bacterium]|nr:hypothetical protein [Chloroflexota bacterium]